MSGWKRIATVATLVLLGVDSGFGSASVGPDDSSADSTAILIPVVYTGPGAHGANWWTRVIVNNHSAGVIRTPGVWWIAPCPLGVSCFYEEVLPNQYGRLAFQAPFGLVFRVPTEVAADLAFRAHFGSDDPVTERGAAELPVVRESSFTDSAIRFPAVVLYNTSVPEPTWRTLLRVYSLRQTEEEILVSVEARAWSVLTGTPRVKRTIALVKVTSTGLPDQFQPRYGQLHLQEAFPFDELQGAAFNITVQPLPNSQGETPRIWAFLTHTDNASNAVTVQTAQ
jgi:hypothetical protein